MANESNKGKKYELWRILCCYKILGDCRLLLIGNGIIWKFIFYKAAEFLSFLCYSALVYKLIIISLSLEGWLTVWRRLLLILSPMTWIWFSWSTFERRELGPLTSTWLYYPVPFTKCKTHTYLCNFHKNNKSLNLSHCNI